MGMVNRAWIWVSCFAVLLMTVGCMKPPINWRYDAGWKSEGVPSRVALVLPVEDARPVENEDASLIRYLPLVLWTTETDQVFDLVLLENGSRFGSVPAQEIGFNLPTDLQEAARRQLAASGKYGPVFVTRSEVGSWKKEERPLWTLNTRVEELGLERRHMRYGLGPLAFIAHALGAPTERIQLVGRISFDLKSEQSSGGVAEQLLIDEKRYAGWYRPLDAEQRLLDHLGIKFRQTLENLIVEAENPTTEVESP